MVLENLLFYATPELVPVQTILVILWWYSWYSLVKLGRVH
jgi:hypothetical protein